MDDFCFFFPPFLAITSHGQCFGAGLLALTGRSCGFQEVEPAFFSSFPCLHGPQPCSSLAAWVFLQKGFFEFFLTPHCYPPHRLLRESGLSSGWRVRPSLCYEWSVRDGSRNPYLIYFPLLHPTLSPLIFFTPKRIANDRLVTFYFFFLVVLAFTSALHLACC